MAVAGAADNVFRTLQTLPGVAATNEFDSRLSVRGGSPDENLTIMDGSRSTTPTGCSASRAPSTPRPCRASTSTRAAFRAYGDRLSSLLVVENRAGTTRARLRRLDRRQPDRRERGARRAGSRARRGSWIVTARRTYYDLVANRLVGTDLPGVRRSPGQLDSARGRAGGSRSSGLLSREATDAFFEGDRAASRSTS